MQELDGLKHDAVLRVCTHSVQRSLNSQQWMSFVKLSPAAVFLYIKQVSKQKLDRYMYNNFYYFFSKIIFAVTKYNIGNEKPYLFYPYILNFS